MVCLNHFIVTLLIQKKVMIMITKVYRWPSSGMSSKISICTIWNQFKKSSIFTTRFLRHVLLSFPLFIDLTRDIYAWGSCCWNVVHCVFPTQRCFILLALIQGISTTSVDHLPTCCVFVEMHTVVAVFRDCTFSNGSYKWNGTIQSSSKKMHLDTGKVK